MQSSVENAIETQYRELITLVIDVEAAQEYASLYLDIRNEKMRLIFTLLHYEITSNFRMMNTRLPANEEGIHFWAAQSRALRKAIDITYTLFEVLSTTTEAFKLDEYYHNILTYCRDFLQEYRGSKLPLNMKKVDLYYTIPIFTMASQSTTELTTPAMKMINRKYIRSLAERAMNDVASANFDSALTKARTILEESFCYVIEKAGGKPSDKGEISTLFNQVRTIYSMHQDKNIDKRINSLLSGLERIVSAVTQLRNDGSDSHGVGYRRYNLKAYHAILVVNSATTIAEFILSIGENVNQSKD